MRSSALLLLPGCVMSHELSSTSDELAAVDRPDQVVLFVDSVGIWDGSKAGQVYTLVKGRTYAELLDGHVNVNALAVEAPVCPEAVTIHGAVAAEPELTSAPTEDPAERIWTCSYPAPIVVLP